MAALTREETQALIQEVLEVYPEKAKKDRAKHLMINDKAVSYTHRALTNEGSAKPPISSVM